MAPQKKVVKTYGKRAKKTLMSDNWLMSPESKQSSKFPRSNAFSDQSNDSTLLECTSIVKDQTNEQSGKELCNLLWSKLELSSPEGSPVLVPETPESEMKASNKRKKEVMVKDDATSSDDCLQSKDNHATLPGNQNCMRIKSLKKVSTNSKVQAPSKENKCPGRNQMLAPDKLETLKILDEILEEYPVDHTTKRGNTFKSKQKKTELSKKNIKKKGRRVSIFHGRSPVVNLEELNKEEELLIHSPCEVMLSRLSLDEIPPDTSSPKVFKRVKTDNIHEKEVENNKSIGIDEYIPAHLSPVEELKDEFWMERSGYTQKSMTPCRGKRGKILSASEKVLLHCGQSEFVPFSGLFTEKELESCLKIGEGVYGEVFQVQLNDDKVAVKIIPIEGELVVNDEPQKTFAEILPEIVISKELSCLRGPSIHGQTDHFIEVKAVHCCRGQFLPELLVKWDEFDERKGSENDRPDSYCDQQLFIVFVFANGGSDLESFQFDNVLQMKSVLQQTIGALAVAEATLQFEHRDLHWGNVLVKKHDDDDDERRQLTVLGGENVEVTWCDLHVSIIDFTLSRLHKDGCTLFYDLSTDESLFQGEGDYQFDMYRLMRTHNTNKWDSFNAYSNVLWVHYLTRKLLEEKRVKRSRKKIHVQALQQLKTFEREILNFKSAQEIIKMSDLFLT